MQISERFNKLRREGMWDPECPPSPTRTQTNSVIRNRNVPSITGMEFRSGMDTIGANRGNSFRDFYARSKRVVWNALPVPNVRNWSYRTRRLFVGFSMLVIVVFFLRLFLGSNGRGNRHPSEHLDEYDDSKIIPTRRKHFMVSRKTNSNDVKRTLRRAKSVVESSYLKVDGTTEDLSPKFKKEEAVAKEAYLEIQELRKHLREDKQNLTATKEELEASVAEEKRDGKKKGKSRGVWSFDEESLEGHDHHFLSTMGLWKRISQFVSKLGEWLLSQTFPDGHFHNVKDEHVPTRAEKDLVTVMDLLEGSGAINQEYAEAERIQGELEYRIRMLREEKEIDQDLQKDNRFHGTVQMAMNFPPKSMKQVQGLMRKKPQTGVRIEHYQNGMYMGLYKRARDSDNYKVDIEIYLTNTGEETWPENTEIRCLKGALCDPHPRSASHHDEHHGDHPQDNHDDHFQDDFPLDREDANSIHSHKIDTFHSHVDGIVGPVKKNQTKKITLSVNLSKVGTSMWVIDHVTGKKSRGTVQAEKFGAPLMLEVVE